MLKACSACGRIHDSSYICDPIRKRKVNRRAQETTEERRLRNKSLWHKKSLAIRERSYHLCAVCKALGDYRKKDIEVHHIKPLSEDPNGLLEDSNLIALCIDHHKKADRGQISREALYKLARERDEKK